MCLTPVEDMPPEKIRALRPRLPPHHAAGHRADADSQLSPTLAAPRGEEWEAPPLPPTSPSINPAGQDATTTYIPVPSSALAGQNRSDVSAPSTTPIRPCKAARPTLSARRTIRRASTQITLSLHCQPLEHRTLTPERFLHTLASRQSEVLSPQLETYKASPKGVLSRFSPTPFEFPPTRSSSGKLREDQCRNTTASYTSPTQTQRLVRSRNFLYARREFPQYMEYPPLS